MAKANKTNALIFAQQYSQKTSAFFHLLWLSKRALVSNRAKREKPGFDSPQVL
jgi:hypothetical protein